MRGSILAAAVFIFGTGAAHAALKAETVTYSVDGVEHKGYLVYDDAVKGRRPGVLVVHEWWGLNDYARRRARMLAELGYTALAVDMYGQGREAAHPDEAAKFSGEVNRNWALGRRRFQAAYELLAAHATTDPKRIAAIGYCFGGGVVLHMARAGMDLAGVVSFHGALTTDTPAQKGRVKARVLVFNGAADPFVKPEHIEAFKHEMTDAGVDFRFVSLPGAKHSFTNPGADALGKRFNLPLAYNAEADRRSWSEMQAFFKEIFGR